MSDKGFCTSKLIEAIRGGSINGVINALDDGVDIEEPDMHGQRGWPLRTACFGGNLAIVTELIRRGANVNAAGADCAGMPLRLALRASHQDIVALLLKHGARIPDDVRLSPQYLSEAESIELPPLEVPVPELPKSIGTETETLRVIEETRPPPSIGTETRLLAMDLLRFNDDEDESAPAPSRERNAEGEQAYDPDGFWKSGRKIR